MHIALKPFLLSDDGIHTRQIEEASVLLSVSADLIPGLVAEGFIKEVEASDPPAGDETGGETGGQEGEKMAKDGQEDGSASEDGQGSVPAESQAGGQKNGSAKKA